MLITSSQVSVAISSFIVFLFTSALFLSGYVLQQQTIRDLRAAVKPQMVRPPPELQFYLPPQFRDEDLDKRGIVDAISDDLKQDIEERMSKDSGNEEQEAEEMVGATRWQKERRRREKLLKEQNEAKNQQVIVKEDSTERVRNSEETQDSEGKSAEKPLSRAERRKKIKEEILLAGEGEGFKGYRRRMW